MYFASLIGNLRNAQIAMLSQANSRSAEVASLTNGVQAPFDGLANQYDSLFETANSLNQAGEQDTQSMQEFSDQVGQTLNSLGDSVNSTSEATATQLKSLQATLSQVKDSQATLEQTLNLNTIPDDMLTVLNEITNPVKDTGNLLAVVNEINADETALAGMATTLQDTYGVAKNNSESQNAKLIASGNASGSLNAQLTQMVQTQVANLPVYTAQPKNTSVNWNEYQQAVKILQTFNQLAGTSFGIGNGNAAMENVADTTQMITFRNLTGQNKIEFKATDGKPTAKILAADITDGDSSSTPVIDGNTITFDQSNEIEGITIKVRYGGTGSYQWLVSQSNQPATVQNTGTIGAGDAGAKLADREMQDTIAAAKMISQRYAGSDDLATYQTIIDQVKQNFNNVGMTAKPDEQATKIAHAYAQINDQLNQISALKNEPYYQKLQDAGEDGYSQNVAKILQWYQHAQQLVGANPVTNDDEATDADAKTNDLAKQYQDLQNEIQQSTDQINQNAKEKNGALGETVKSLTDATNQLKQTTDGIRNTLNGNVNDAQNSARDNQTFADNFNRVMENARNGEADNAQVYNFLSNPLRAEGNFGATRQTSILPFFMTVIGTIGSLLLGLGISRYLPGRRLTRENALVTHSRGWLNLPALGVTLLATILVGTILGLGTASLAGLSDRISWTIYTILFVMALSLWVMILSRYSRMVATAMVTILLALYVMLSPFLGILTRAGSIIAWLYRWSPLQNIQTGYLAMYNGGIIGLASLFGLFLLVVVSLGVALIIKPLPTQLVTDEAEFDDED
ncbi:hypothetical protein [Limosilactobacillus equigenerosi]|nr:hypothetical protein [Limosilactobacillus equigenerosi]